MKQMSRREQNRLEKQDRILSAALKVFSKTGYANASMDDIATAAGLTKPTLYSYFQGKEALFQAIMTAPRDVMMMAFETDEKQELVPQLLNFAWAYGDTVMHPDFLALARLIIGEAHRFPDIGKTYQQSGPDQVLRGLMFFMEKQRAMGRLIFEDPELAAEDFWGLILSAPRNRALHIPDERLERADLARYVHNGLRVFLRAYSANPEHDLAALQRILSAEKL